MERGHGRPEVIASASTSWRWTWLTGDRDRRPQALEYASSSAGYRPACLGLPAVVTMKATEDGVRDDLSGSLRLIWLLRAGDALLDALVWSC